MAPSAAPAKPKTAGTTSKACLANLPLELKARIVSLAEQQDAAYEARMVVYREAKEWKDKLGGGGEWYGRSVFALSGVSKEFNTLAGKFIFETITTTKLIQGADLDTFCTLLHRHSPSIRTLEISHRSQSAGRDEALLGLTFACGMPNLRRILVHQVLVRSIDTPEWAAVKTLLQVVGGRITAIESLGFIDFDALGHLLRFFPRLERIHAHRQGGNGPLGEEEDELMVDALLRQRSLQHLYISSEHAEGLPPTWLRLNPVSLPNLTSLTWHLNAASSSAIWPLVYPFVSQLTSLTVDFTDPSAPPPSWTSTALKPRIIFPKLTTLVLEVQEPDGNWPIANDLSRFSFPVLQSLHFDSIEAPQAASDSTLLDQFPQLRRLTLSPGEGSDYTMMPISAEDFNDLRRYAKKKGRQIDFPQFSIFRKARAFGFQDPFVDSKEEKAAHFNLAVAEFSSLAQFLEKKVKRLAYLTDRVGILAMVPLLEGLDELRQLELD